MAVPALANRFGLAMLGTYHDRVGNGDSFVDAGTASGEGTRMAAWGRVFGQTGNVSHGGNGDSARFDNFQKHGLSYDFNMAGVQVGMDLYRALNDDGSRDQAGVYVGAGRITSDVSAVFGGRAGSASMNGYSLGGYWTHKGASGWYVDAVMQGTRYDRIRTNSVLGETLKSEGWSFTASLEGGAPIALSNGWSIEPQAQLIYQSLSLDSDADRFGSVKYDDADAVFGRAGTRLAKAWAVDDGSRLATWARANVWHSFGAQAKTTFSALTGLNPVALKTDLGGTWGQVGAGVSAQVAQNVSVFVSGDYNFALGDGKGHSVGGRLGVKIVW
jgi:outer membrane autotransporter protein